MFCSVISANPEMLDDYEGTIAYLDRITRQYPEISVTYMSSPALEPCVYMNNGWRPPEGWRVETRPWYVDAMASENGWTISAPYFDDQTGLYCVTFAERVYDGESGRFRGNFGIDFFMDKLIDILGGGYSDTGYAFLSNTEGIILNHPYGSYQMTKSAATNVSEVKYGQAKADGKSSVIIRDYDGALRIVMAKRNADSRFTVYEAVSLTSIYLPTILAELLILTALIICSVMVWRLLTALMLWQNQMNARMREAADTAIAAGKAKSRFLAQMSHEIRTPINAVLGMNERRPDLILLDIHMPGMDGFGTLEKIRENPATASIPVAFLTADEDSGSETRALQAGAMDFVKKPFVPEVLLTRVRHIIDLNRLRNDLENQAREQTAAIVSQ